MNLHPYVLMTPLFQHIYKFSYLYKLEAEQLC
jgi:hypothetical protein